LVGSPDYVGYRTASSMFVGSTKYEVGQWYEAPYLSWCPLTDCHPGIYLHTLEWVQREYPGEPIVRAKAPAGEYCICGKGVRSKRVYIEAVYTPDESEA